MSEACSVTWADRPALPVVAHLVAVQPGGVLPVGRVLAVTAGARP